MCLSEIPRPSLNVNDDVEKAPYVQMYIWKQLLLHSIGTVTKSIYTGNPCSLHNLCHTLALLTLIKQRVYISLKAGSSVSNSCLLFQAELECIRVLVSAPSCLAHHDSPQTPLQNHKFKYLRWCNCQYGWQALMVTVLWNAWLFSQTIKVCLWIFCYLGW